jgi:DNA-binding transcriptional MerR regulator
MTIQQASISVGLPASTIRYYEKEGILPSARRDAGGRRIYSSEDIERMIPVSCLSATGMSLKDMRAYLRPQDGQPDDLYARLHLDLIENQKKALAKQKQLLRVRMRYLQIKTQYWKAREAGDEATAEKLSQEASRLVIRMQG